MVTSLLIFIWGSMRWWGLRVTRKGRWWRRCLPSWSTECWMHFSFLFWIWESRELPWGRSVPSFWLCSGCCTIFPVRKVLFVFKKEFSRSDGILSEECWLSGCRLSWWIFVVVWSFCWSIMDWKISGEICISELMGSSTVLCFCSSWSLWDLIRGCNLLPDIISVPGSWTGWSGYWNIRPYVPLPWPLWDFWSVRFFHGRLSGCLPEIPIWSILPNMGCAWFFCFSL